ncbi:MAG: hypothetical protein ACOCRO_02575 [Halanaerobiales bacterium]
MPVIAQKKDSKMQRERLNTTIKSDLLYKAQALRFLLKAKGINTNGVNDLIEEGLEMVLKKYEKTGCKVYLEK